MSMGESDSIITLKAIDLVGAKEYNPDLGREKQHLAEL